MAELEKEKEESFRGFAGLMAGAGTTIGLVIADLALSFNGLIGVRSEWVGIVGLAIASFAGAIVLVRVTSQRWPQIVFIVVGAALFWLLVLAAAAMTSGHPDHNNDPIPLYHIIASGIAFFIMSGPPAIRKTRLRIAVIFIACSALVGVIFGQIEIARETRVVHEEAQRQIEVMQSNILPRLFANPKVTWSEPHYANYMFSVDGNLQRPSGTIQLQGYRYDAFALIQIHPTKPYKPSSNKSANRQRMEMMAYLKSEGIRDDVLSSGRVAPLSTLDCELKNVPSDVNDPSRGAWDLSVEISIAMGKIFVNVNRSTLIAPGTAARRAR